MGGGNRSHRRAAGESGRDLDHGLVDHHRHRVEVGGPCFQPQPLRFQRDGAAAGEGIMEGGQLVRVEQLGGLGVIPVQLADLAPALADLGAGTLQHFFVVGVFPLDQFADDVKQLLAPLGSLFLVDAIPEPAALLVTGVVDHLRKQHRPRRGQRPPRPPQVQGAGVPVADGLLPCGITVDVIQRQGDFDEFFGRFNVRHRLFRVFV